MRSTASFSIELLAPARDAAVGIAAINHGADAVYIGAPSHGARAMAANSVADIARLCEYAHLFSARVYVTVNTLVYEPELAAVEKLIGELYRAGVDALIVQDMGLLRLDLPPIALHASTQCDIRTPAKARFLEDLGFSQLVLPRELTLSEIREMRDAVTVPLEGFVHGALCVSYSGDCRASFVCGGRSANRGECAQICRMPYDLIDGDGHTVIEGKHLLSLRDLNQMANLQAMIEAGISSFKIEGRLKDETYVKNVVSAYDAALRQLGVARTSIGRPERTFAPDVSRSFNRGFTSHFLFGPKPAAHTLANPESPKSSGPVVATVESVKGKRLVLKDVKCSLVNGDGLGFGNRGFRVNRVEGNIVHLAEPVEGLKSGMTLRRNFDKAFTDLLSSGPGTVRVIGINATLRRAGSQLVLENGDGTGVAMECAELQTARSPQEAVRLRVLSKLGATVYRLDSLDDRLGAEFVPASVLTGLRQQLVEAMDASRDATFTRPLRLPEKADARWPGENNLTFHDNVANSRAEAVYRSHGVTGRIEPALEVAASLPSGPVEVMCTRYCLRREFGRCLLTPQGRGWREPLTLRSGSLPDFNVEFDCRNCRMRLLTSRGDK